MERINAMTGSMIAMKIRKERDRFEKERKKWIERRGDCEYLMVNCRSCNQPFPRQKILRINEDHLARWRVLAETEHANFWALVMFPPIIVFGVAVGYFYKSPVVAVLTWGACFALDLIRVCWSSVREKRAVDAEKKRILSSYSYDIPVEDVGLASQYDRKFALLQ